ncbi:aromatic ring-hydroxylating dioxygenase subunit alpha [Rivularia sp. UHCC 0363]|uniref:aromatic ring-hydroxylating dioxygenase subunit alpha n=1 Tax=Rivularia sp. UHCC 0363 TaxID=3110244 RepID=UPI002B2092F9|nr:aromatic ring-hydroxylating dioxygenase subunit alpha [Rivularia sp. UHCC 0363]MEA5594344.1 aromatic ring-hydroxylating dioxygenase subunit alpha [Rivularia sp. UHCC 0363]
MKFADFWYVAALSNQLKPNKVLSRIILGEWLAVFRGEDGKPVALQDRCIHRNSRLSKGKVCQGKIQCPYHGWVYDHTGTVVTVPSEGKNFCQSKMRKSQVYQTLEQDGLVYVRLSSPVEEFPPFKMPNYQQPGWETVKVINRFHNNVTNCAENFIDVPHTTSVHPGIFRKPTQQQLEMTVERRNGCVFAEYRNETTNLGWFTKFLNNKGYKIRHIDSYRMPNVTSVEYDMSPNRKLFITSQCIPETESTLVYTCITYNYGIWNKLVKPFVHWTTQYIIRQDIEALKIQWEVIEKYGTQFTNTPADTIHIFVESIRNYIAAGKDPRTLPDKLVEVKFWV